MTTYVVRVEESKEFVGIYAASNEPELFWLVDQLTDPYICEYARLNFGGVCFAGKCSRFVTLDEMNEREIYCGTMLNGPRFTDEMYEFEGRWKAITKDCYPKRDGTDD
jgi:hypothetical protein